MGPGGPCLNSASKPSPPTAGLISSASKGLSGLSCRPSRRPPHPPCSLRPPAPGWLYKATKQDDYMNHMFEYYVKHLNEEAGVSDFK